MPLQWDWASYSSNSLLLPSSGLIWMLCVSSLSCWLLHSLIVFTVNYSRLILLYCYSKPSDDCLGPHPVLFAICFQICWSLLLYISYCSQLLLVCLALRDQVMSSWDCLFMLYRFQTQSYYKFLQRFLIFSQASYVSVSLCFLSAQCFRMVLYDPIII